MTSRKKTTKPKLPWLTGNVRLVAVCVVGVILLTFMAGYLTGKMYWNKPEAPADQKPEPVKQYHPSKPATLLNPEEVRKKTSAPDFTFPEKLSEEIKPAPPAPPAQKKAERTKKRKPAIVKRKPARKAPPVRKAPAKRVAKKTAPVRALTQPAKKTLSKKLTVQVGSFKSLREARALSARLNKRHYNAYVKSFEFKGQPWYRVRVGVFDSLASARRMALKLAREQKLPTLLAPYAP